MLENMRTNRAFIIALNGLVVLFTAWVLSRVSFGGIDLTVYRDGALTLRDAPERLYGTYVGPADGARLPFTYPPFAAFVFMPLTLLSERAGYFLFVGASVLVTFLVAWDFTPRLQKLLPVWGSILNPIMVGLIFLASGPVRDSMDFGQINVLLLGALYLTFVRCRSLVPFAIAVGILAGIKLTPLALLVAPFAMRKWGATAAGVLSFLGTQLFTLVFATSNTIDYWTRVIVDPARIGNPGFIENVSIQGALARVDASKVFWVLISAVVGLTILAVIWAMNSAERAQHFDRVTFIALAATASLLLSPVSWTHHWVWWPMMGYAWLQVCQYYWTLVRKGRMAMGTAKLLTGVITVPLVLGLFSVYCLPRVVMMQFGYQVTNHGYPAVAYILPLLPVLGCIVALAATAPVLRIRGAAPTPERQTAAAEV